MQRSYGAMKKLNINVIPVATDFINYKNKNILSLLPNVKSLSNSTYAIHEWVGIIYYLLRGWYSY